MIYRKKALVVEAVQFIGDDNNAYELKKFLGKDSVIEIEKDKKGKPIELSIVLDDAILTAQPGDFIVNNSQRSGFFVMTSEEFNFLHIKAEGGE